MVEETPQTTGAESQELRVIEWLKAIRRLLNTGLGYSVLAVLDLVYSAAWTVIGFHYKEAQFWTINAIVGIVTIIGCGLTIGDLIASGSCDFRQLSFTLDEKKDYQHRLTHMVVTILIWPTMFYIAPSEEDYDSDEDYSVWYVIPFAIFVGAWASWGLGLFIPRICRHYAKNLREATSMVSV